MSRIDGYPLNMFVAEGLIFNSSIVKGSVQMIPRKNLVVMLQNGGELFSQHLLLNVQRISDILWSLFQCQVGDNVQPLLYFRFSIRNKDRFSWSHNVLSHLWIDLTKVDN